MLMLCPIDLNRPTRLKYYSRELLILLSQRCISSQLRQ